MAVYLDHNASAPLHAEVLDAMMPFLQGAHGNASSLHRSGRFLRSAIEAARAQVAELLNADPRGVIFTSGGSEANNLALKGFVPARPTTRIAASPIEHASVLQPLKQLAAQGCTVDYLKVNRDGMVDISDTRAQLQAADAQLLTLQLANNETGAIQPLVDVTEGLSREQLLIHSDATQAVGKVPVDFRALDIDIMTLSAHKLQGPQGCGALVCRPGLQPQNPLISGGPQERGQRAGTENVALLVGLGKACELARINLQARAAYLLELRAYFEQRLLELGSVELFAADSPRLPNTSFFAFPFYHGETLLMQLDQAGFELASGSACHSEVTEPSHVLRAMGIDDAIALNAVRVSFGIDNTREQVDELIALLKNLIDQVPAVMRQATG